MKNKKSVLLIIVTSLLLLTWGRSIVLGIMNFSEMRGIYRNETFTMEYWDRHINHRIFMLNNMERNLDIRSMSPSEVLQTLGTVSVEIFESFEGGVMYISRIHYLGGRTAKYPIYEIYFNSAGEVVHTVIYDYY